MVNQHTRNQKIIDKIETEISLREVHDSDLNKFFKFQLDKEANYMAAFTSKDPTDRKAFANHWNKILANPDTVNKTIIFNNSVVGHIAKFISDDKPEITYWIDKKHWGKGIATEALRQFLKIITIRPLYARVAKDNTGSNRVLEKSGFVVIGEDRGYAEGRGEEIDEYIRLLSE